MQAIILAAGIGNRLGDQSRNRPKSLLEFDGKSLMQRHIELLIENRIESITIVVGYQADLIRDHLSQYQHDIHFIENERYTDGSLISLNCARDILLNQEQFLIMDADVLYHPFILERLINTDVENCLLIDRDFIPGDEPVKVCIDGNDHIIEFRKQLADDLQYEKQGESVGFFKFTNHVGQAIIERIDDYLAKGLNDTPYEEAIRDCLLNEPSVFGYEDVTGLEWIEIDFPEDIIRARDEILPAIKNK